MVDDNEQHLRSSWAVQYSGQEVSEAVNKKIAHHTDRARHYEGRVEETLGEIRESGIQIDEVIDDPYSNTTGYRVEGARIDQKLNRQLHDVQAKVKVHRSKLEEFSRWQRLLARVPANNNLSLRVGDIEFFGL